MPLPDIPISTPAISLFAERGEDETKRLQAPSATRPLPGGSQHATPKSQLQLQQSPPCGRGEVETETESTVGYQTPSSLLFAKRNSPLLNLFIYFLLIYLQAPNIKLSTCWSSLLLILIYKHWAYSSTLEGQPSYSYTSTFGLVLEGHSRGEGAFVPTSHKGFSWYAPGPLCLHDSGFIIY